VLVPLLARSRRELDEVELGLGRLRTLDRLAFENEPLRLEGMHRSFEQEHHSFEQTRHSFE